MLSETTFSPRMIVFTAPSGSGKTTIVRHLLSKFKDLAFSVSATSRKQRVHEKEGVDYYFIDAEAFKKLIRKREFIEWEEVYTGQYYGTLKSEIERLWSAGKHVVFDIDVKGAMVIKSLYQEQCITFFIKTPTFQDLIFRLKKRKTESQESLMIRVDKARKELEFEKYFEHVIVNEELGNALNTVEETLLKLMPGLK